MPDWRAIVEQHLDRLRLPPARRVQVEQELSEHLEDELAALRRHMPEEEAQRHALRLLDGSETLSREIRNLEEEDEMNQSTRALWMPGLVLLVVYSVALVALGAYLAQPGNFPIAPRFLLSAGLVVLLVLGAVGAAWARANGATRAQRAMVSLFPVLMPIAGVLIVGPVQAFLQGRAAFPPTWEVTNFLIKGVAIPAVGLLLGALPFLRNGHAQKRAA